MLGWSKAKGEICPKERINVGAANQLEPDITFRINGEAVFVVAAYLSAHPMMTFSQLQQVFPDELQGITCTSFVKTLKKNGATSHI